MNGWFAVLTVLGCALAAPLLGWLFCRVFCATSVANGLGNEIRMT